MALPMSFCSTDRAPGEMQRLYSLKRSISQEGLVISGSSEGLCQCIWDWMDLGVLAFPNKSIHAKWREILLGLVTTDWMDHGNILPFFLENASMRNAEKFMRNGAKTCEL